MKYLNHLLACLLCAGALTSNAQETGPNILPGDNFASLNPMNIPKGWFVSKQATRESDQDGYSMKVGPNPGKGAHLRSVAINLQDHARPAGASNSLLVRCKFKTSGAGSGAHYFLMFRAFDGTPDQVGNTTGNLVAQTVWEVKSEQPEFREQEFTVPVPDGATYGDFCVMAMDDSVSGALWIRDISAAWQ